jgi:hypothetical protein
VAVDAAGVALVPVATVKDFALDFDLVFFRFR